MFSVPIILLVDVPHVRACDLSYDESPTAGVEIDDLVLKGVDPSTLFTDMAIVGQGYVASECNRHVEVQMC
jgi:hypothetical protein